MPLPEIASAIVTVIAACAAAFVSIYNAIAAAKDRRERRQARQDLAVTINAADQKADTILTKTSEIHTATNGTLSKLQAALDVANERILGLEKLVATIAAAQDALDRLRRQHGVEVATALAVDPLTVHAHRRETDPQEPV